VSRTLYFADTWQSPKSLSLHVCVSSTTQTCVTAAYYAQLTITLANVTTLSQNSSLFLFLWVLGEVLTDILNIAAEKICNQMISIQFVYGYYRIKTQERFCMVSMLPLRVAVVQIFQKYVQSSQFPTFFENFTINLLHNL